MSTMVPKITDLVQIIAFYCVIWPRSPVLTVGNLPKAASTLMLAQEVRDYHIYYLLSYRILVTFNKLNSYHMTDITSMFS